MTKTHKIDMGAATNAVQGDTLLVYLIDRSGSMTSCWAATMEGLDADIATQRSNDDGKTEAAVYVFDTDFSGIGVSLDLIYQGPLKDTPAFANGALRPRGGTPLYGAVGMLIEKIDARVSATGNPVNVLFSILTDGGDNCAVSDFPPERVKVMVETRQGQGWTFTYFGANQDAWAEGSKFGIAAGNTVAYNTSDMGATMAMASVARSAYVGTAKAVLRDTGKAHATASFFADAGQGRDDYT